ncbi:MAG: CAP domain-containing protein [Nakamurella sp.]
MDSQGTRVPVADTGRRGPWGRTLTTLLATALMVLGSVTIAPSAAAGTRVGVAPVATGTRVGVAPVATGTRVGGTRVGEGYLTGTRVGGTRVGEARATVQKPRIVDQIASFDTQMIAYVNQARLANGVQAVREATGLTIMSAWWSRQMTNGVTNGRLQHNPNAWTQVLGYGASNRRAWGENVAKYTTGVTAKQLFDAYMASPGHRANILSPKYNFIGMGTVGDAATQFNTMEFTDQVETRTIIGATMQSTK